MKTYLLDREHFTKERIRAGYSIRGLARRVHVNPATILRIERGETSPSPQTAKAICDAMETTFDNVFTIREE